MARRTVHAALALSLLFYAPVSAAELAMRQTNAAEFGNIISAINALLTAVNLALLVWTLRVTAKAAEAAAVAAAAANRTIEHETAVSAIELRPFVLRTDTIALRKDNGRWL